MTSRGEIERIIDETYAARRRNDPIGTLQHIADDFEFRIMGSHLLGPMGERITSRSALTAAMTDLCENWDFADVRQSAMWVEGDTAIVKRGGPIRHRPSGQVIDTSFIEIMTVKNGKISAFEQYVDTQLIAHTLEKAAAAR